MITAQARDKVPAREDTNGIESHGSSSPSPSSSPSSHYTTQPSKTQTTRANSSSSARSPESDDQNTSLQPLKTESLLSEDATLATNHRTDETKSESNGIGGRCISAIFATHSKLRRLLGTLVQFATDISPDTGDTVRALVLNLLVSFTRNLGFHLTDFFFFSKSIEIKQNPLKSWVSKSLLVCLSEWLNVRRRISLSTAGGDEFSSSWICATVPEAQSALTSTRSQRSCQNGQSSELM